MTKEETAIVDLISKRRKQCLIHRYLYYVKAAPLISDLVYDLLEGNLKQLIVKHPLLEDKAAYSLMCPTKTVGSDNLEDYPREIEQLAESLLNWENDATGVI